MTKQILVTGAAGFIGASLSKRILEQTDWTVVGIDNLNDYYDPSLKEYRLKGLRGLEGADERFEFVRGDIADAKLIEKLFAEHSFDIVVNLAAQAGVRYSIENPRAYIEANLIGFFNILEACRNYPVEHLVFASSSSVYGGNSKVPYEESDHVDHPVSLYAATKKSDELMAHAYAHLYGIPSTGLRFFTVYGPAGRPDMAYFKFTNKIVKGEPIQIYNNGDMRRDFTFIEDIVDGIIAVMGRAPEPCETGARYKVYNIGHGKPEGLMDMVIGLEQTLLEEGVIEQPTEHQLLPMQPGDVYQTWADTSELERDFGYTPQTDMLTGMRAFAKWYKEYYQL